MKIKNILFVILLLIGTAAGQGFTVKSVSYVPSHIGDHNGNVTILFSVNDAGQKITGTWNGEGLPEDVKLSQPVTIQVHNHTETLTYPILNYGSPIHKYYYYYVDAPSWSEGAKCPSKPAYCYPIDTDRAGIGLDRVIVVYRDTVGSVGALGNPDLSQKITLSLTLNDIEYSQDIGSGQEARGAVVFRTDNNQWIANAIWTGMTMTGAGTPNQDLYIATHLQNGDWQIAYKNYYDEYVKSLTDTDTKLALWQDEYPDNFDNYGYSLYANYVNINKLCEDSICSPVLNQINLHNAAADDFINQNVQIDYAAPTFNQETEITNGNVIEHLNRQIGFAEIVLTMSASDIGIVSLAGTPKITDISIQNYSSGDTFTNIKVSVTNAGKAQGTFGVITPGSYEQRLTLEPDDSGFVILKVINLKEGVHTGKIEVYDLASEENDTQQYQVNVAAPKLFVPNDANVYNNALIQSDKAGMQEEIVDDCHDGIWQISFDDGERYNCIHKADIPDPVPAKKEIISLLPPVPVSPLSTQLPKSVPDSGIELYVWIIMILILIIVIMMLVTSNKKKRIDTYGIIATLAVIAGLGLLFVHFWPGIKIEIMNILKMS